MSESLPATLCIIGGGHVGMTLGRLWHQQRSFIILDVMCRTQEHAQAAAAFIGTGRAADDFGSLTPADAYLLSVPDDQIVPCCERLTAAGLLAADCIVFHCSGSLPASAMQAAIAAGCAVASVHPVRSFAVPEQAADSFAGTYCGTEGDERALKALRPAFAAIGARLVGIDPAFKMLYHAAAVFASNYLVTVLDAGLQAYAKAGVPNDEALKMMEPLVRSTIDNVFHNGTKAALSGPIARRDVKTVLAQYHALRAWDKPLGKLYKTLGKQTARLARRRKNGRS